VQAGYLAGNPLALWRQRTRRTAPRITRYLEPDLWEEVKDYIASMPQDAPARTITGCGGSSRCCNWVACASPRRAATRWARLRAA
jgi:hypothetical protein